MPARCRCISECAREAAQNSSTASEGVAEGESRSLHLGEEMARVSAAGDPSHPASQRDRLQRPATVAHSIQSSESASHWLRLRSATLDRVLLSLDRSRSLTTCPYRARASSRWPSRTDRPRVSVRRLSYGRSRSRSTAHRPRPLASPLHLIEPIQLCHHSRQLRSTSQSLRRMSYRAGPAAC